LMISDGNPHPVWLRNFFEYEDSDKLYKYMLNHKVEEP